MCIKSLPPVMVIQLKRFGYDWEENRALKFNDAFQVKFCKSFVASRIEKRIFFLVPVAIGFFSVYVERFDAIRRRRRLGFRNESGSWRQSVFAIFEQSKRPGVVARRWNADGTSTTSYNSIVIDRRFGFH